MDKTCKMLIINPGSTSTKIALYQDTSPVFEKKLTHSVEQLSAYNRVVDQLEFRLGLITDAMAEEGIDPGQIDAFMGRGGLTQPVKSGVYEINRKMLAQLASGDFGEHASNLGAMLAKGLGDKYGKPSYIADPVVVDEMWDIARLSGLPQLPRVSILHALNQKAVARRAAKGMGREYKDCRFIVAHLGGGISVACHIGGRCVDVNNALGGDGPYTPERAGGVPVHALVDMCFAGQYSKAEIKQMLVGKGGLTAYLGTNDGIEVCRRIEAGDEHAALIYKGMAYQVAKEIGACAAAMSGEIDAILLTGGLAYDKDLVREIEGRVSFAGQVLVFPGEDELLALAESGMRVLKGEEQPKTLV